MKNPTYVSMPLSLKSLLNLVTGILLFAMSTSIQATLIDFSDFIAADGVSIVNNSATFQEDITSSQEWLFNPAFYIPTDATKLSFSVSTMLDLWPELTGRDYFEFLINFIPVITIQESIVNTEFNVDLTSFRGQTVDLEWALSWGGSDLLAGSQATLSNVLINTLPSASPANPVPEPSKLGLLMALFSIFLVARKNSKDSQTEH